MAGIERLWPCWLLLLLSVAGCGDDSGIPRIADSEILLRIDVASEEATRVGVRVWNEAHDLVHDAWLDIDELSFPRHLRLFPNESTLSSRFRSVYIEVELFDADSCIRGRQGEFVRYREGERVDLEWSLEFDADMAGGCEALFVESDPDPEGPCVEGAPCDGIGSALYASRNLEAPTIIYVAGNATYGSGRWDRSPSLNAPLRVRAWPGRGISPPRVEAANEEMANIYATQARELVVDGIEAAGGLAQGLVVHSSDHVEIRHCTVRNAGDQGSFVVRNAQDVTFFHNHVEGGTGPGMYLVAPEAHDDGPSVTMKQNLFVDVGTHGLELDRAADDFAIEMYGNTFCGGGGTGIFPQGPVTNASLVAHDNAIFDFVTGFDVEDAYDGTSTLLNNTFDANTMGSLAQDATGITFEGNIASGATAATFDGNAIDQSVEREGCFFLPTTGAGVCETFPDC